MKSHKTPLRYPGGKSRACTKIGQFLPNMYTYREFREPFLGGGSVAIYLTKMYPTLSIWVNDLYEPLVNFWKEVQHSGEELYTTLSDLKIKHPNPDSAKGLFLESKEIINSQDKSKLERAVAFYVVNKCSFSGLTESSSFSAQASDSNFSMRGIEKLTGYQEIIEDWKITNLSYEDLLTDWKDTFIYLDPPYDIKDNLYGKSGEMHKKFDHDKFAKDCDDHTADMMISYNSSQLIKNRFKDWNAVEFDLTYTMRSVGDYMSDQQARKELLLLNYGTQGMVEVDQFVKEESY
jgi:DNA adenine methylase